MPIGVSQGRSICTRILAHPPAIVTLCIRIHVRRPRKDEKFDIYNATNTDVVTTYNQTFVQNGPWLTPTAIQPARYAKVSAQIDFWRA